MKTFITTSALLITLITVTPHTTHAYKTTSQSAEQYNATTALFEITYRFGFLNRELYIPVSAGRTTATSSRTSVSYTLVNKKGEVVDIGTTTALVLSTATIKDGQILP
jgi:hypothetical protein